MKFVCYDPETGEIRTWGESPDPSPHSELGTILEGEGANPTHCVVDGALVAYTSEQIAAKAAAPSYPATWSNATFAWIDQRALPQAKADKWSDLKAARDATLHAGFTWDGSTFDSDETSQSRIQGAVQLAGLAGAAFSTVWVLADNTTRTLSAADMVGVGLALGAFAEQIFTTGAELRAQVEAATTAAQIGEIAWPSEPTA